MKTEVLAPSSIAIWPDAQAASAVISGNVIGTAGLRRAAARAGEMPCIGCGKPPAPNQINVGIYIPKKKAPLMFYACCVECAESRAGVERSEAAWNARFDQ